MMRHGKENMYRGCTVLEAVLASELGMEVGKSDGGGLHALKHSVKL